MEKEKQSQQKNSISYDEIRKQQREMRFRLENDLIPKLDRMIEMDKEYAKREKEDAEKYAFGKEVIKYLETLVLKNKKLPPINELYKMDLLQNEKRKNNIEKYELGIGIIKSFENVFYN